MAVTWVRGARCGVNNCSSRFYEVSGGHRVCQNGHVQDGLEAAADDDDYAAIGRRIHVPRRMAAASDSAPASKVVHGREAFALTLSLLQDALAAQVAWVRRRRGLGAGFDSAVRALWHAYVALATRAGARAAPLSLRDLVVLCYLGMRCAGARVLLLDFLRWIALSDFPYVACQRWLDAAKFERVPIEQRRVFTGLGPPPRLALYQRALVLRTSLERALGARVRIPPADTDYALVRLCRDLMLPPEVFAAARRLLRDARPRRKLWASEELPAALALVMATKLAYGLDGLPRVLVATRRGEQIDWRVWKDVVRKTWLYQPVPTAADERLAAFWGGADVDNYLAWQQHTVLPPDRAGDRLLAMFPLQTPTPCFDAVDNDTLTELTSVVHSTTAPTEEVAADGTRPDAGAGAGSHYQIYASRREFAERLPEITEALYEVLGALLNTEEEDVRRIVRGFENWARRAYGREAFWDAPENAVGSGSGGAPADKVTAPEASMPDTRESGAVPRATTAGEAVA